MMKNDSESILRVVEVKVRERMFRRENLRSRAEQLGSSGGSEGCQQHSSAMYTSSCSPGAISRFGRQKRTRECCENFEALFSRVSGPWLGYRAYQSIGDAAIGV